MTYEPHPCAMAFPLLEGEALKELVADIQENGLREPITLWRADKNDAYRVLDGRNRQAALVQLGIDIDTDTCTYLDDATLNPATFVISKNIHRRHLTKPQQASLILEVIAAGQPDTATMAESVTRDTSGRLTGRAPDPVLAEAIPVAASLGISKRSVERARAKSRGPTRRRVTRRWMRSPAATPVVANPAPPLVETRDDHADDVLAALRRLSPEGLSSAKLTTFITNLRMELQRFVNARKRRGARGD